MVLRTLPDSVISISPKANFPHPSTDQFVLNKTNNYELLLVNG